MHFNIPVFSQNGTDLLRVPFISSGVTHQHVFSMCEIGEAAIAYSTHVLINTN